MNNGFGLITETLFSCVSMSMHIIKSYGYIFSEIMLKLCIQSCTIVLIANFKVLRMVFQR